MHESLFASWSNTNERTHLIEVYVAYRKTKYEIHGYVVGGEIVHSAFRRFWSHAVPLAGDDEVFKPSNPGRFSS